MHLEVKWLNDDHVIATNAWTLWIVPSPKEQKSHARLLRHESIDPNNLRDTSLFHHAELWSPTFSIDNAVVIASAFDDALWKWLNAGGKVLMLPDGRTGSFPISEHWFLRGGPIVNRGSFGDPQTAEMIETLQAFDLGGPVMPKLSIIDEVEPLFCSGTTMTFVSIDSTRAAGAPMLVRGSYWLALSLPMHLAELQRSISYLMRLNDSPWGLSKNR